MTSLKNRISLKFPRSVCCLRQETVFLEWGIFGVNFYINCLEDADYQNPELNTWGAVLGMSTETPLSARCCGFEVGKSPGLLLRSCSNQF